MDPACTHLLQPSSGRDRPVSHHYVTSCPGLGLRGFSWDTGFKMLIEKVPDKSEGVELFSLDLFII